MTTGTKVALMVTGLLVVVLLVGTLLSILVNPRSTKGERVMVVVVFIAMFVMAMIFMAHVIDTSCRNPDTRPCVGVSKDPH